MKSENPDPKAANWARWIPALVPTLLALVAFVVFDSTKAVALLIAGLTLGVLIAFGVPVERWIGNGVGYVVRGLSALVGWILFILLILPAWLWTKLRRIDPLAAPPTEVDASGSDGVTLRKPVSERSRTRQLIFGVGVAVLLILGNYLAGWTWDAYTDSDEEVIETADPTLAPPVSTPVYDLEVRFDPRVDSDAMKSYPWREQYFEDIQKTISGYWPFTEMRPYDFKSEYLNVTGWIRESYEPAGPVEALPTVWMFGGSTTWGEGQRDEYTIASHLSRIAEEQGIPIDVSNYGQRGWTHFQELVLFEQQVNLLGGPDVAIFYDGANEIAAQSLMEEAVPTHLTAFEMAELLGALTLTTRTTNASGPVTWSGLVDEYREHSAIHKVLGLFQSESESAETTNFLDREPGGGFTEEQPDRLEGDFQDFVETEQDGIDAGKVYERGKLLTQTVAEDSDVNPLFFWQPMESHGGPREFAIAQLSPSTIDISHSLDDHPEVFIDGVHTNEEGARIVAEAIWAHLEPQLRDWYEDNR